MRSLFRWAFCRDSRALRGIRRKKFLLLNKGRCERRYCGLREGIFCPAGAFLAFAEKSGHGRFCCFESAGRLSWPGMKNWDGVARHARGRFVMKLPGRVGRKGRRGRGWSALRCIRSVFAVRHEKSGTSQEREAPLFFVGIRSVGLKGRSPVKKDEPPRP